MESLTEQLKEINFWIMAQNKLTPLSSELEHLDGQEGEITEVNADDVLR